MYLTLIRTFLFSSEPDRFHSCIEHLRRLSQLGVRLQIYRCNQTSNRRCSPCRMREICLGRFQLEYRPSHSCQFHFSRYTSQFLSCTFRKFALFDFQLSRCDLQRSLLIPLAIRPNFSQCNLGL